MRFSMSIEEIIEKNKEDADEIDVIIQESASEPYSMDDEELYHGMLGSVPKKFYKYVACGLARVIASSEPDSYGTYIIVLPFGSYTGRMRQ